MQRRRNAGDDMHPLRFGVSAENIGGRRTAAVVKTKSREVVNLAGKGRGNWFSSMPIAREFLKKISGLFLPLKTGPSPGALSSPTGSRKRRHRQSHRTK